LSSSCLSNCLDTGQLIQCYLGSYFHPRLDTGQLIKCYLGSYFHPQLTESAKYIYARIYRQGGLVWTRRDPAHSSLRNAYGFSPFTSVGQFLGSFFHFFLAFSQPLTRSQSGFSSANTAVLQLSTCLSLDNRIEAHHESNLATGSGASTLSRKRSRALSSLLTWSSTGSGLNASPNLDLLRSEVSATR
jgi:hypothetical protein